MEKLKDYILQQVFTKQLSSLEASQYLERISQLESCQETTPQLSNIEFAVIGMSCRFPQANNPLQFWHNLLGKKDAVGSFPRQRMQDVKLVNQQTYNQFKDLNCRIGTYFDRIDLFDHTFFGLTPAEVRVMDPSQRIFLEVAIEAIQNAGLTEELLRGSKTGVYVGFSISDDNYIDILSKDDPNVALGNQPSLLAYRLSFLYDLRGPTMIIDTACSSSLVAVHQACQAIIHGDCNQAIVGGVNVRIFPAIREIGNLGIEAYDGRCKTFDEKANGTNIGDGVAALIIKKKEQAEKDGDYIHAIIKGSAVNSDGSSNGITAPNPEAQMEVLVNAWNNAKINPENLSFIETHGTGTKLGDPIEINGLTSAFKKYTSKKQFCPLGAVKTNIGHLEATSGLAGLIKAILCLKYRQLPPNIHFNKPNPYIDFANSAVYVNSQLKKWEQNEGKLTAGISSFGISGTNCHVVIEEYYKPNQSHLSVEPVALLLSAKNEESLRKLVAQYPSYLDDHPQFSLHDICYSSATARDHYEHRIAFIATSLKELKEKIIAYCQATEQVEIEEKVLKNLEEMGIFYVNLLHQEVWKWPVHAKKMATLSLTSLLNSYLNDQKIDWKQIDSVRVLNKVPIPTYSFNSKRHWPKLEIEEVDNPAERLKTLFHSVKWIEEPLKIQNHLTKKIFNGSYLFFIQNQPEHENFCNFAIQNGIQVIRVYPGNNFQQISSDTFCISPEKEEDYRNLLNKIIQENEQEISGIIHCWDCLKASSSMKSYEDLEKSQTYGSFSHYYLARAYKDVLGDKSLKLVSLTAYAHSITELEDYIDPTRMPALGINKVISQEFPKIQSLAIDIDIDHFDLQMTPYQLFNDIFEIDTFKDSVIAYRKHKRYVQILESQDIDTLPSRELSIRDGGVYLIAGGAGYLGLETALSLAQQKPVKIALISRRDSSKLLLKQNQIIEKIRQLGSEVIFIQADVTQLQDCQRAIQMIKDCFGSIHGVFVAIKNISHKRLDDVEFKVISHNILSKLRGVWLLDHFTSDQDLDFMATFSSISSLTGGPTGADCCASNLFLDSYGDYRNRLGKSTITMNYTLIEADDGSLLSDRLSMIPPITKEEFIQSLNICLSKQLNFSVIADFDKHIMNLVLPFMKIRFSDSLLKKFSEETKQQTQLTIKTQIPSSNHSVLSLDDIQFTMKQIWKDVLGYTDIENQANFFDIGGDSISSVKLTHLAKVQLQIELNIPDLYTYPVFQDLCRFVYKKLYQEEEPLDLKNLLDKIESGSLDPELAISMIK